MVSIRVKKSALFPCILVSCIDMAGIEWKCHLLSNELKNGSRKPLHTASIHSSWKVLSYPVSLFNASRMINAQPLANRLVVESRKCPLRIGSAFYVFHFFMPMLLERLISWDLRNGVIGILEPLLVLYWFYKHVVCLVAYGNATESCSLTME